MPQVTPICDTLNPDEKDIVIPALCIFEDHLKMEILKAHNYGKVDYIRQLYEKQKDVLALLKRLKD